MSRQAAELIFWVAAVACAVAQLAILRAVFVRPAGGDTPASSTVPRSPRGVEILWAVFPAVALAALLGATWRAIH